MSAALLVVGVGCAPADSQATLQIVVNQATAGNCPPTPGQPGAVAQLGSGFIDTNAFQGYVLTPQVVNDASTEIGEASDSQRRVQLAGANITTEFLDQASVPGGVVSALESAGLLAFSRRFSGSVEPNGGVAAIAIELWPQQFLTEMRGQLGQDPVDVQVTVQMFGTVAGDDVSSQEFVYPVTICDGCLINNLGACDEVPPEEVGSGAGDCQGLQDPAASPVTCCTGANGLPFCEPPPG